MRKLDSPDIIMSDSELLSLLHYDRDKAFTLIYEKYHKLLYVLAFKYLKSSFMAEDAVQFVFLKLLETHSLLSVSVNLRNYLYTMLKNHLLNEIRNNYNAVEKNYEMAQSGSEYEDDLLTKIEDKDMMDRLYLLVEQLPLQKKLICLYKLKDNLSNQEIAEKMNISVATVKSHYTQAIKILQSNFELMLIIISIVNSTYF
nr:sigma-70 family RNA polymerase sigma factor [uncultured Macellibacteroides sp.]